MDYSNVKSYVIFLRYKRSGSALLSSLLNAHPDILFPRMELLFSNFHNYSREELFNKVATESHRWNRRTFKANGYEYPIEGVKTETPLVIGHKSSTRSYLDLVNNGRIPEFQSKIGVPLKFVHLVRNPYNLVAARWMQKEHRRRNAPVDPIIDDVIKVAETHDKLYLWTRLRSDDPNNYLSVCLERLIESPSFTLINLCGFLGVRHTKEYADTCRELIFDKDDTYTHEPPWTEDDIQKVRVELIDKYPYFFGGYYFK